MHDRLIVGFDGSEQSQTALRWAAAEAETRKASVRVISSYSMPPVMDYFGLGTASASPESLERLRQRCVTALRAAVAESVRNHPGVGFDERAVNEPPVERLLGEAAHADLLVVGQNGLGAVRDFLLGSVTGALLHESTCPVAVVPAVLPGRTGRIVVGVDSSDPAAAALHWAADEADRLGTELVITHAWHYPYKLTVEGTARGSALSQVDAALVVDEAVEVARNRMAGDVVGRLVEASAAQALLDAGDTADMVVVGSRGHGGFHSMLLGSVAHTVAARASCPVVVVR